MMKKCAWGKVVPRGPPIVLRGPVVISTPQLPNIKTESWQCFSFQQQVWIDRKSIMFFFNNAWKFRHNERSCRKIVFYFSSFFSHRLNIHELWIFPLLFFFTKIGVTFLSRFGPEHAWEATKKVLFLVARALRGEGGRLETVN